MNAEIEIKEMPKMNLAYVSSIGSKNLGAAYQKLIGWASPKGLMHDQTKMITVYFDSFKVTAPDKVRMNASILLNEPIATQKEIGLNTIVAGKHIVGRYEIEPHEFEKSWTVLFLWMNENGYKKADAAPFEIYYNDFNTHPEKKVIVDMCIPIK